MRRRIPALVLTAALAGGALATVAQVATAQPAAAASITVDLNQMRQQVADLRAKANRLDREGERDAARRARAQADALQRRIDQIEKSERESGRHF
ncbi:hypothetical protein ATKI12_5040 [Kitasatospora sp. Ki12]|uniref:hypothetical protein n=1 Tax=Kitasatospora xanthocidica TaxID=83382 RepID=UPI0016794B4E|nr:hypothetical protein [Kitasatospora xanthocidica]GHF65850.1 hypothetical protein GCM10018790_49540 [Kitasatospora xanthocidica]